MQTRIFGKTQIIAALSMLGVVCTVVASAVGGISPETGMYVSAIGAAITLFCGRIQGHPADSEPVPAK